MQVDQKNVPPALLDDPESGTPLRSKLSQIFEELLGVSAASRMTPFRFVDQVEHEFKTPLTSIRSLAEILRDNPDLPPKMREQYLRIVLSESARLEAVVGVLLEGLADQNLLNRPEEMQDVLGKMSTAAEDARREDQAA